jgi:hypothetical protein
MSRPDSPHVTALKSFRERLIEARRAASRDPDLDAALRRFIDVQHAIDLVDKATGDELDLTPLPKVDDPTEPEPKV